MPACALYWNEASLCTGIACAVRETLSVWRSSAEILAGECVSDAGLRRMLIVYATCVPCTGIACAAYVCWQASETVWV
jgi:hypothetical protein